MSLTGLNLSMSSTTIAPPRRRGGGGELGDGALLEAAPVQAPVNGSVREAVASARCWRLWFWACHALIAAVHSSANANADLVGDARAARDERDAVKLTTPATPTATTERERVGDRGEHDGQEETRSPAGCACRRRRARRDQISPKSLSVQLRNSTSRQRLRTIRFRIAVHAERPTRRDEQQRRLEPVRPVPGQRAVDQPEAAPTPNVKGTAIAIVASRMRSARTSSTLDSTCIRTRRYRALPAQPEWRPTRSGRWPRGGPRRDHGRRWDHSHVALTRRLASRGSPGCMFRWARSRTLLVPRPR